MRVLFLTLYPDSVAGPRYRVAQFIPHLEARGIRCSVASAVGDVEAQALMNDTGGRAFWYHLKETPRRVKQLLSSPRYDAVFVHKAIMSAYVPGLPLLLRSLSRRLVYDFDDAMHLAPPHALRFPWRLVEDRGQIRKILGDADLVLAGNRWLVGEAERSVGGAGGRSGREGSEGPGAETNQQPLGDADARVVYFPTVVDTARFVPAAKAPEIYRIGWIGYPKTMICLEPASGALHAVQDVEICLVGGDPAVAPWTRARVRPWSLDTEAADVQSLSVGIMPLLKNEWMKGKCASKALVYMACGVPCVATPFGAALEVIEHGKNGLFADSTAEWLEAFERLREPALRRAIGQAARATVEERYSLRKAAARLADLLEAIA